MKDLGVAKKILGMEISRNKATNKYTRPDIAYTVRVVSRFIENPGKKHWWTMKWIFHYLKGTLNIGLVYYRDIDISGSVTGFVNSNYAVDKHRRKSMTCYIFTLSGCTVS